MDRTRYLVVGAGISGLAFADRLDHDDYLILEADSEIGGYCKTVVKDGFVWDYSGHFFHFKHPELEAELVARMGSASVLKVQKDARIHWGDRHIDFPFQKNIHQLPQAEFIECLYDLYFREPAPAASFKDMLYARFGRAIAEKFLVPYNEKLYATDLARLDVEAMGRFFPYADVDEIVRNFKHQDRSAYNANFTYPRGGAIQYVQALAMGVDAQRISLGEALVSIDLGRRVARTSRREVQFDYLISSAPFDRLLRLCGVAFDEAVYTANRVLVFNLGFDRKGLEGPHWMYFPQRELCFYRVGFYDNIFGDQRMSLYVEVGLPSDASAASEPDLGRVLADLRRAGIVGEHKLVAHHSVTMDPAYVHITAASNADVAEKKQLLAAAGVYSVGRYGSWTYCSIEDNMVEARQLADRFNALTEVSSTRP